MKASEQQITSRGINVSFIYILGYVMNCFGVNLQVFVHILCISASFCSSSISRCVISSISRFLVLSTSSTRCLRVMISSAFFSSSNDFANNCDWSTVNASWKTSTLVHVQTYHNTHLQWNHLQQQRVHTLAIVLL